MRRTLLGQRIRATAAVVISAALVGALAPAEAQGAQTAQHAAPSGPVRAGAGAEVSATFDLRTRVAAAQPAEPGDHLEVAVGEETYSAPTPGSWICPTGVWVLQLDRESLEDDGSADYPLCTPSDAAALATRLTQIGNDEITIVNSLNHSLGGNARTLPGLGDALATIGVPADQFAAVDLSLTAFSVFGIPKLAAGQAYSATESLDDEAGVKPGSATGASVNGTLALDRHEKFTFNPHGYVLYDVAASGAITLGGHTYQVPTEPAGFGGGFHVLVVDRRSLAAISDTLYATNNNPSEQYRMGSDLARLAAADNESVLIFLATVGNPVGGAQLPAGPTNLPKECTGTAAFTVTCTYTPTAPADGGSEQQFTVPGTVGGYPVSALHVSLQGGYGGYALSGGNGGDPDRVTADLPVGPGQNVKPGQSLYVEVAGEGTSGGQGNGGMGGWNGGGNGGGSSRVNEWGWPGGGGGGASDIRTVPRANGNTAASLSSRLVVAAGGGGAGGDSHDAGRGGNGGAAASGGGDGLRGSSSAGAGTGGGRGTESHGGAAGSGGYPGDLGIGGSGHWTDDSFGASGGGGGGYYGGGGGGVGGSANGGGGGGGGGGSDLVPHGGTVDPVTNHVPASVSISYQVPFGTLAQALRPFGATPTVINGLDNSPRYALIGTLASPTMIANSVSLDSPEASPQIARGATGELQGVLQQRHEQMWYESITSNAPIVRSINGKTQPPTVTNYGLYHVISDVHADWPVPVATPIATHDKQENALKYISQQVCGCDDIRDEYNAEQNIIQTWRENVLAAQYPVGNPDFDTTAFTAVQTELGTELRDVFIVDGLKNGMHTLLSDQQQMLQPALTSAYHDVREAITVDDHAKLAIPVISLILELLTVAAEFTEMHALSAALGVVNALLKFGTELATDLTGNDEDALTSTAVELGEETANTFADALSSLSQTFSYIYEDWGKLSAVATGLTKDEPAWDVTADNAGQYVTAASDAIKLGFYRALVSVTYQRVESSGAHTSDFGSWCLSGDLSDPTTCRTAAGWGFANPSSAYTFPGPAPGLGFKNANDNILLTVNTGCCWDSVNPLAATLTNKMTESGLFVPYLFLRWPMFKGATCPAELYINNTSHGTGTGTVFQCIPTDFPQSTETLTITTHHLPDATVGKHYRAALKATGSATGKYRWTVQNSSHLPAGLTLSAKGVLSGVPSEHGRFPIRVAVNSTASATLMLTIHPPKHTLANSGVPTVPLLILAGVLIVAGVLLTARRRNSLRRSSGS